MSKKGRFYRVHFKTGSVLDLVPPGSIAMGMTLIREGNEHEQDEAAHAHRWQFVTPPLKTLWREFVETADGRPFREQNGKRTKKDKIEI